MRTTNGPSVSRMRRGLAILALLGAVGCAANPAPPAPAATAPGAAPTVGAQATGGSAAAAPVVPAAPPAPVRRAQVEPGLTVGLSVPRAGADRGFCAEEGVTMEFTTVTRGDTRLAVMVSGDAQLMLGTDDVIRAREKGLTSASWPGC
jgi:hypothetical protein